MPEVIATPTMPTTYGTNMIVSWCWWCQDWCVVAVFDALDPFEQQHEPFASRLIDEAQQEHDATCKPDLTSTTDVRTWLQR